LKKGNALSPWFSNSALEYAIRKFQANKGSLKLNGIHQLQVYADYFNILRGSIHTRKNTETLVIASKDTDLEVNVKKANYVGQDSRPACTAKPQDKVK
jgi:hypothetical protein